MDPKLQEELLDELDQSEMVELIMRLNAEDEIPENVEVVSAFGNIITCRIQRSKIRDVYGSELKRSLKASRQISVGPIEVKQEKTVQHDQVEQEQEEANINILEEAQGDGVVVAIIDWGIDFAHPNFLNADGTTRLKSIWDQSQNSPGELLEPYGYGKLYTQKEINAALEKEQPYAELNYHPGKSDPAKLGAHGTHVCDIAAGNGTIGKAGMAPKAEIIFVHLASKNTGGTNNMGDSVRILEAIDFVRKQAGEKKLVINMSMGRQGGPHDGLTLVEQAMDNFLENATATMICQSTGNYYKAKGHSSGVLHPGKKKRIDFEVDPNDRTANELEVWYSGKDLFEVTLKHEGKSLAFKSALGKSRVIRNGRTIVGRIYHRSNEPNNGKNHIDIFLYKKAPSGKWTIEFEGKKIKDGRFNAWIERDGGCRFCQTKFESDDVNKLFTTGTICNGYNTIVVGAYNNLVSNFAMASFSSSGPTIDGRSKPDLIAPGVEIRAAKSTPLNKAEPTRRLTNMSGTSMATPHVTGLCALVLELLPEDVKYHDVREIVIGSASTVVDKQNQLRIGAGKMNKRACLQKAKTWLSTQQEEIAFHENNQETLTQVVLESQEQAELISADEDQEFDSVIPSVQNVQYQDCNCTQENIQAQAEENISLNSQKNEIMKNDMEYDEYTSFETISFDEEEELLESIFFEDEDDNETENEDFHTSDEVLFQAEQLTSYPKENLLEAMEITAVANVNNLFETLASSENVVHQKFELLAAPGEALPELEPGDIMLSKAIGESEMVFQSVIADGTLLQGEYDQALYTQVVETYPIVRNLNDQFMRRITNGEARLREDALILRLRESPIFQPIRRRGEVVPASFPFHGVTIARWGAGLRRSASSGSGYVMQLPRNTRVVVLGRTGNWLRVTTTARGELRTGFISQELVDSAPTLGASPSLKTGGRNEVTSFGSYNVYPNNSRARLERNELYESEFIRIRNAWNHLVANTHGIRIIGIARHIAQLRRRIGNEMERSISFRNIIVEMIEDTAHPIQINVGRNNAFWVDSFAGNLVDLSDHDKFTWNIRSGYEWAQIGGELIIHWMVERWSRAVHGSAFPAAHGLPLADGGAQHMYRGDLGQPGRVISQTRSGSAGGLHRGIYRDTAGNVLNVHRDASGGVHPTVSRFRYVPSSGSTLTRHNRIRVSVTASTASRQRIFIKVKNADSSKSKTTSVSANSRTAQASGNFQYRHLAPSGGKLIIEIRKQNSNGTSSRIAKVDWSSPFVRNSRTLTVGSDSYTLSMRLRMDP